MSTLAAAVVAGVVGLACGTVQRGLLNGGVPGFFIGAVAGLVVSAGLAAFGRGRRGRARHLAGGVLGAGVTAVVTLWVLRAPGPEILFRRYVLDGGVRFENARAFHCWRRDPSYAIRFETNQEGIDAIVAAIRGIEDRPPRRARHDLLFYAHGSYEQPRFDVPEWWRIEDIPAPRTWRGKSRAGPVVQVRYDPDSGTTYLEIIFM